MLDEEILEYQEHEWQDIITPIKVHQFEEIFVQSGYDSGKMQQLIEGFSTGFSLGYEGPEDRQDESNNLPFHIGDHLQLFNKVMKEVKEHRYTGPFDRPPTEQFIQSPIGLVPKAGGKMRLIFIYLMTLGKNCIRNIQKSSSCFILNQTVLMLS